MTDQEIAIIKARCEKATPPPWNETALYELLRFAASEGGPWDDYNYSGDAVLPDEANAEFIARSREDVPALLAEVERLRKVETELLGLISESYGVDGLHLNGDLAEWSWLLENGWFESLRKEKE